MVDLIVLANADIFHSSTVLITVDEDSSSFILLEFLIFESKKEPIKGSFNFPRSQTNDILSYDSAI